MRHSDDLICMVETQPEPHHQQQHTHTPNLDRLIAVCRVDLCENEIRARLMVRRNVCVCECAS